MSITPIRRSPVAALAFVLALVIAACGGATDEAAQADAADPIETAQPVEDSHDDDTMHDDHEETDDDSATHEDETGTDEGTEDEVLVEVVMTEFAFEPAQVTVSAGQTVKFVVTNEGVVNHEFRLSNEHRIEEHIASGHESHGAEGGHHEENADLFIELEPGAVGELAATFTEDTTIYTNIACLIPGHHEAGMVGDLTYGA